MQNSNAPPGRQVFGRALTWTGAIISSAGLVGAVGMICLAVGFIVTGKADTSQAAELPNVEFQTAAREVRVTIAGKPVATYIHADQQIRRPYFAHVKSPGGM